MPPKEGSPEEPLSQGSVRASLPHLHLSRCRQYNPLQGGSPEANSKPFVPVRRKIAVLTSFHSGEFHHRDTEKMSSRCLSVEGLSNLGKTTTTSREWQNRIAEKSMKQDDRPADCAAGAGENPFQGRPLSQAIRGLKPARRCPPHCRRAATTGFRPGERFAERPGERPIVPRAGTGPHHPASRVRNPISAPRARLRAKWRAALASLYVNCLVAVGVAALFAYLPFGAYHAYTSQTNHSKESTVVCVGLFLLWFPMRLYADWYINFYTFRGLHDCWAFWTLALVITIGVFLAAILFKPRSFTVLSA